MSLGTNKQKARIKREKNCQRFQDEVCAGSIECEECEDFVLRVPMPEGKTAANESPRIDEAEAGAYLKDETVKPDIMISENRVCENCGKFGGFRADMHGKKVMCGGHYKDTLLFVGRCAAWVPQNMMKINGYYFSTIEPAAGKLSPAQIAITLDPKANDGFWKKAVKNFGTPVEDFLPDAKDGAVVRAKYETGRLNDLIEEQPSVETEPETMSFGVDPVTTEPSPAFQAFQEMGRLEKRIAALETWVMTERTKDITKPTEAAKKELKRLGVEDVPEVGDRFHIGPKEKSAWKDHNRKEVIYDPFRRCIAPVKGDKRCTERAVHASNYCKKHSARYDDVEISALETMVTAFNNLLDGIKKIEWHARNLHYKAPEQLGDVHSVVDFFWKKLLDLLKKYDKEKK